MGWFLMSTGLVCQNKMISIAVQWLMEVGWSTP
jgi:hypothetical protein